MKQIDTFLNGITMYKLVIFGLLAIAGVGMGLSLFGLVGFSILSLFISLIVCVGVALCVNELAVYIVGAPRTVDSSIVTALILFLILAPIETVHDAELTVGTVLIAVLSKYIIAYRKKHLFNPAALGLVIMGLFGSGAAFWWTGSVYLFPVVAIVGFLVTRKIRREVLVLSALGSSLLAGVLLALVTHGNMLDVLMRTLISGPMLFMATIMLTEPATTPPRREEQIIYGTLVGLLSAVPFRLGTLASTPELSLILGNIYSYTVSLHERVLLTLVEKKEIARGTFEFIFKPERQLRFVAGQYLEWTLPHTGADMRGIRRYFTIASAPEEAEVHLGIKIPAEKASSYKAALAAMTPGSTMTASGLCGDFVLPKDVKEPIVMIAGGIGITPFRSMIEHIIRAGEHRSAYLFNANKTNADIAYMDLLNRARDAFGLSTIHVLEDTTGAPSDMVVEKGFIDGPMLARHITNVPACRYYISGPSGMVNAYKSMLMKNGVAGKHIVTDYFPGFA